MIAYPPPENRQVSDVWSSLGGDLKPSVDLVITMAIEPDVLYEIAQAVMAPAAPAGGRPHHLRRRGRRPAPARPHREPGRPRARAGSRSGHRSVARTAQERSKPRLVNRRVGAGSRRKRSRLRTRSPRHGPSPRPAGRASRRPPGRRSIPRSPICWPGCGSSRRGSGPWSTIAGGTTLTRGSLPRSLSFRRARRPAAGRQPGRPAGHRMASTTPTWPRSRGGRRSSRSPVTPIRLRALAQRAGLDELDVDLLLVALAPDLDSRFERLYGYLNDDVTRRRATIGLSLELCGASAWSAAARAGSLPTPPSPPPVWCWWKNRTGRSCPGPCGCPTASPPTCSATTGPTRPWPP